MPIRSTAKLCKGKPCPTCPWRKSSVGSADAETVGQLREVPDTLGLMQACHAKPARVCVGFALSVARKDANLAFPLVMSSRRVTFGDLRADEPLFGSWDELFQAHGVKEPSLG